jgi:general nucleoside transport system ATP-binding protein
MKTASSPPKTLLLRAIEVSKTYGEVTANKDVTLDLLQGEIHAVLGENGAGKSTFMKILYGLELPNSGQLELRGERLALQSPYDAIRAGIGMVHQHFMLVPTLTVLENLVLGSKIGGKHIFAAGKAAAAIGALARKYGLDVDLDSLAGELSVGEQQRVEILKALVRGAGILILDEPTAVLTPPEITKLLAVLRDLARQGLGILLVTHKLAEVMEVADRASVMRAGRMIGTWKIQETTAEDLVSEMIGRSRNTQLARKAAPSNPIVLELMNVEAANDRGLAVLHGVRLTVRAGEIVGIAGVEGNGQREIAEVITGLRSVTGGDVVFCGETIRTQPTVNILRLGVGHVPEDRHRDGLVLDFSVAENAVLVSYRDAPFRRKGLLVHNEILSFAKSLIQEYAIRCNGPETVIRNLSGGNQQKLILGREIARKPKLLVVMQPTRGLDIGAIDYVHARLMELRNSGVAILLVSTELDEIMTLSDRIAVLRAGKIVSTLDRADATVENVGHLMLGDGRRAA